MTTVAKFVTRYETNPEAHQLGLGLLILALVAFSLGLNTEIF